MFSMCLCVRERKGYFSLLMILQQLTGRTKSVIHPDIISSVVSVATAGVPLFYSVKILIRDFDLPVSVFSLNILSSFFLLLFLYHRHHFRLHTQKRTVFPLIFYLFFLSLIIKGKYSRTIGEKDRCKFSYNSTANNDHLIRLKSAS